VIQIVVPRGQRVTIVLYVRIVGKIEKTASDIRSSICDLVKLIG
jgi:hypothetical protein